MLDPMIRATKNPRKERTRRKLEIWASLECLAILSMRERKGRKGEKRKKELFVSMYCSFNVTQSQISESHLLVVWDDGVPPALDVSLA